ncbi:MAG: CNNM domain-containing protein [Candidatus Aminicenantes bacterium]|jgi:CBS domain containing-hemolysin-like protein
MICKTLPVTVFVLLLIMGSKALAGGAPNTEAATSGYTDTDIVLLVVFVLLALIVSFLCSVAEAVLLSITPSYIARLREVKPKLAALLKRLKQDNVDQSLAAILTLNTIAHTVGAVGAGAKAAVVFGSVWVGVFSAVMTLMILFLSEIIPKTLGAVFWRKLAGVTAIFVHSLILTLYPLIKISEGLTRLIARRKNLHLFSREEFIAMARIGEQTGEIDEDQSRIIRNLFRLESLKAADIMTPRTVIAALGQDMTVTQALNANANTPFSRLPLYRRNLDDITGFILKDDMLLAKAQHQGEVKLEKLKREIMTIIGEMSLSNLLESLLDKRQHIALVVDEYGGTKGLVTLEDVVETLLGMEIVDEMDKIEDMQALARQQWAKRARALGLEVDPSTE